jgi:hypothetical protein
MWDAASASFGADGFVWVETEEDTDVAASEYGGVEGESGEAAAAEAADAGSAWRKRQSVPLKHLHTSPVSLFHWITRAARNCAEHRLMGGLGQVGRRRGLPLAGVVVAARHTVSGHGRTGGSCAVGTRGIGVSCLLCLCLLCSAVHR